MTGLPANENAAPRIAAHMDDFRVPDLGAEDVEHEMIDAAEVEAEAAAEVEAEAAAARIDKATFWTVFQAGFAIPQGFSPDFAPLAIQSAEKPAARAASDAVHSLLEIYYPRALEPMGQTFALALTAGPFLFAKVQIMREILADRRARRIEDAQRAEAARREAMRAGPGTDQKPANTNAAPASGGAMSWMDQEAA